MKNIYGVAIIGCGHMGSVHMEDIYYKDNVKIVCACDIDLEKAREFQKRYCAERIESDYRACVCSLDVDIVIIATYPTTHLNILRLCIEQKKHVICEKPMSTNIEDGKAFLELVQQNREVKVLIGYILRHNQTYQKVAELIQAGAIGKPVIMRMVQNHHTMDWEKYLSLISETSPIVDCGVHYIDVMQWFTGEKIIDISGIGVRTEADVPPTSYNYGLMTARLSNGLVGYFEAVKYQEDV